MRYSNHFLHALTLAAALLSGCALASGLRIDNIPMYGQPGIERPEALKRADEDFISQASAGFGSREKASIAWWLQAEKFMSQGNLDFAMRRYNQSWLLNPNSFRAYWGFGRVMLEKDQLDEALIHLDKACQLVDDEYQKVALLADTATAYSVKANLTSPDTPEARAGFFARANHYYEQSTAPDAAYPNSWRSWARSLYFEGRYAEAWEKVRKARALGAPPFPPQFIRALEEKMAEPQ